LTGHTGAVLGVMNATFYEAISRIPLGVTVTIEFLGPLAVAIAGSRRWRDVLWALLAAGGVALLTNGGGHLSTVGLLFALGAATCWGCYILLSAKLGKYTSGGNGLAVAMGIGGLLVLPLGVADAGAALVQPLALVTGLGVALLSSVVPYSVELEALRRIPPRVFGVLMSLEPAVAALCGLVVLGQRLGFVELLELRVERVLLGLRMRQPRERVTVVALMRDTDQTPDGGYSAGFLSGADNLRKVGAYTYQTLLRLASKKLRVSVDLLTVQDGIVSGSGQTISYTDLVRNQRLDLTIPVSGETASVDPKSWNGLSGLDGLVVLGNPPTRPMSKYKIVGTSNPMPGIPDKVTGRTQWTCDVTLPNMLHARMVRPATLGSTLLSAGTLDETMFPNAQVIVKKNLVAVVSPNEWEAVSASQTVAANTKWTNWAGLPTSAGSRSSAAE